MGWVAVRVAVSQRQTTGGAEADGGIGGPDKQPVNSTARRAASRPQKSIPRLGPI